MFSFKTLMDRATSRLVTDKQKAESTAPQEVRRIPRKQFDAVMVGAKAAMRELTEFSKQAKSRLREDRPIKQDDLVELLHKLIAAQKKIDYDMESDVAKSADTADTEWDRQNYNLFAVQTSRMANSPQKIVDGTLAASQDGAKDLKLLYELTVAEMDVAVARFNATLSVFPALRVTGQAAASGNLSGRANNSGVTGPA
jgi:Na+/phosphate symporter